MSERADYATAKDADVAVLRESFESGYEWTKERAAEHLGIPARRFRTAVAALREQGVPIVSWSEEGSTYRMARDGAELDRFIDSELWPRMRHLERQARALRTIGRSHLRGQRTLI